MNLRLQKGKLTHGYRVYNTAPLAVTNTLRPLSYFHAPKLAKCPCYSFTSKPSGGEKLRQISIKHHWKRKDGAVELKVSGFMLLAAPFLEFHQHPSPSAG